MIYAVMLFGPCHGKTIIMNAPINDRLIIIEDKPAMFQPMRDGMPDGPARPSMLTNRHTYVLHDSFDQGMEEVALYFHHEGCCNKTFEDSKDYKENHKPDHERPSYMHDRPIWDDEVICEQRDEAQRLLQEANSNDWKPAGKIGDPGWPSEDDANIMAMVIQARQNGKSKKYVEAMLSNHELMKQEGKKK